MAMTVKNWILLTAGMLGVITSASAADLVKMAERSPEIQTFMRIVDTAGLTDTFKSKGPFTLFVPSDSAFDRLPDNVKKSLLSDKKSAAKLISDHVVQSKLLVVEISPGKTKTIDGSQISLTSDNGLVKIDGASVIQSDLVADNGVIHIIDKVVQPDE